MSEEKTKCRKNGEIGLVSQHTRSLFLLNLAHILQCFSVYVSAIPFEFALSTYEFQEAILLPTKMAISSFHASSGSLKPC